MLLAQPMSSDQVTAGSVNFEQSPCNPKNWPRNINAMSLAWTIITPTMTFWLRNEGNSLKCWVGVCRTVLKTLATKIYYFSYPFLDLTPKIRKSVHHFRPSFNIATRFPGTGFRLHNAPLEAVWMSLVNVKITREINKHHVPCQNHTLFQTKKEKPY